MPDGMTIDKEDKLWLTTFGGGAIHRVDPTTGSVLQSIPLPASKVSITKQMDIYILISK